jgi:transcriptional regulator GlxA family with amidase domain
VSRTILILIYEDVVLSSAAAPLDIFTRTNQLLAAQQEGPAFDVSLIANKTSQVELGVGATFDCTQGLADFAPKSAGHNQFLIVVPAFAGNWDEVLQKNRDVIEWLKLHYQSGTEIASLCKGSYFLAEAGLLDGKPCTSHMSVINDMRARFPAIHLQADAVVTDKNGIYTGGGAFSSLNLVLYLIEKFCGHETGIQIAKNFSIQRDHSNQSHFANFKGLTQHGDALILSAQAFIENTFAKAISVEDVADHANMSKRNFIRRFKQAVQMTPMEYMQRIKIEAAKKAFEQNNKSIQSVIYDVGYNDAKTFRDTFKKLTGITPQDYRKKYARNRIQGSSTS